MAVYEMLTVFLPSTRSTVPGVLPGLPNGGEADRPADPWGRPPPHGADPDITRFRRRHRCDDFGRPLQTAMAARQWVQPSGMQLLGLLLLLQRRQRRRLHAPSRGADTLRRIWRRIGRQLNGSGLGIHHLTGATGCWLTRNERTIKKRAGKNRRTTAGQHEGRGHEVGSGARNIEPGRRPGGGGPRR